MWASLSEAERAAYEEEAVLAAPPFLQRQYRDGQAARGTLWKITRRKVLLAHFSRGGAR
jgi:hypothetical protein